MKQYFFLVALGLFALLPGSAAAFDVTNTKAYQVTDDTYLYMIEFEYGYLNAEAWLPILTNTPIQMTDLPELRFDIVTEGGEPATGTARGVVLSEAERRDTHYYIAQRERETFTLVAVYQAAGAVVSPSLEVTTFTHLIRRSGETDYTTMSPTNEQLDDYRATLE